MTTYKDIVSLVKEANRMVIPGRSAKFVNILIHPKQFASLKKDSEFNCAVRMLDQGEITPPMCYVKLDCGAYASVNHNVKDGTVAAMLNCSLEAFYQIVNLEGKLHSNTIRSLVDSLMTSGDVIPLDALKGYSK